MKNKLIKIITLTMVIFMVLPTFASFADEEDGEDEQWVYIREDDPCKNFNKLKKKSGSKSSEGGTNGDFLTPGTKANKVAHEIFDTLTEDWGFSSAAAIGILANCSQESGFIVNRAEDPNAYCSPYTGSDAVPSAESSYRAFEMDSDAPVEGMGYYASRTPPHFGGGGLFQFTPYTKFTSSKRFGEQGKGWEAVNQVAFLLDCISNGDIIYNGPAADAVRAAGQQLCSDFEDLMGTDSPEKAASSFFAWYERGAGAPARDVLARKVYDSGEFDTGRAADPSKWPDMKGSGGKSIDVSGRLKKDAKKQCKGKKKTSLASEFNKRCVQLALSRVGGTYVWGGNTWGSTYSDAGMDCSGFTMETIKRAGLKSLVPRTAADQGLQYQKWGWEVDKEDAVEGDIVVFSKAGPISAAEHIGWYGGKNEKYPNGFFIHASNPKDGIIISSATYYKGSLYYFHPEETDGVEFGEPDMSDTDEIVDFDEAFERGGVSW